MHSLTMESAGTYEINFLHKVYGWMAVALAISAISAGWAASSPAVSQAILHPIVYLGLFLVEIALIVFLTTQLPRLSHALVVTNFLAFSILDGVTLSIILPIYSINSIASAFFVTAVMFGFMSVYGYLTKRNLTTIGHLAMFGVVGLLIALFVSIFWANQPFNWAVTIIGILLFLILTAYDTQKLKAMAESGGDGDMQNKLAIRGALSLYLDMINLFLFVLRLGRGRK